MTDKTFDTIPREVIELGSKLTAAELRCVIDMLWRKRRRGRTKSPALPTQLLDR